MSPRRSLTTNVFPSRRWMLSDELIALPCRWSTRQLGSRPAVKTIEQRHIAVKADASLHERDDRAKFSFQDGDEIRLGTFDDAIRSRRTILTDRNAAVVDGDEPA